jgi:hypothetical protein
VVWIALAIHGFVMAQDDLDDGRAEHLQFAADIRPVERVEPEKLFFVAVALGVAEHRVRYAGLADVVEQGPFAQGAQFVRRQAEGAAHQQRQDHHVERVEVGIVVGHLVAHQMDDQPGLGGKGFHHAVHQFAGRHHRAGGGGKYVAHHVADLLGCALVALFTFGDELPLRGGPLGPLAFFFQRALLRRAGCGGRRRRAGPSRGRGARPGSNCARAGIALS